jgi:hypothetical protein
MTNSHLTSIIDQNEVVIGDFATLNTELLPAIHSSIADVVSAVNDTNVKLQTYLGDVEGAPSSVSLQDQVASVYSYLYDETLAPDGWLKRITGGTDGTNNTLTSWDDGDTCKVTVEGGVDVTGTVSVEPGLAPLDVIVIP